MYDVIYNFEDFKRHVGTSARSNTLFWIIEYSPKALGMEKQLSEYLVAAERYSLLRTECLEHATDFVDRLNNGVYRIWTVTPYELEW